jgi:acyl-CoA thioesterase FadM
MTDAVVIYRAESFAGDRLCFEVAVGQLKRVTCDLFYRVTRMADARLIAEVKTGVAFRNPTTRKPVPLPALMHQLSAL